MTEESDVWPDALHTRCATTFGWWDRVLVLLGWELHLRLHTPLPVVIPGPCGDTTTTGAMVAPRWWRRLFPLKPVALGYSEGP